MHSCVEPPTCQVIVQYIPSSVRDGKEWKGIGKMIGIGKHIDQMVGQHCNFVMTKKHRNLWSNIKESMTLQKCGEIFKKQFGDKEVGFNEMLEEQKRLWPKECPDELKDEPRTYNGSENLGNEMHRDDDDDRLFPVWVDKMGDELKSWYLLFPQWEIAIQLTNGTWISWDSGSCGHCSAVPEVYDGDRLVSLFCLGPKTLGNHLRKKWRIVYLGIGK